MSEYYFILGINSNATITDIKKAYRNKAKQYHPDKNSDEDSQQKFIEITEAYEFLLNNNKNPNFDFEINFREQELKKEAEHREKIKAERIAHAKQRYETFKNSNFYKNDQAFLVLLNHLQFFILILLISLPLILISSYLFKKKIIGAILSIIVIAIVQYFYKKHHNLDIKLLSDSLKRIFKIKQVHYTLSILVSFYLFFTYTLNTQICTINLLITLISCYVLFFGITQFKTVTKSIKHKIYMVRIPLIFNLFFLLNFQFSSNLQVEKYVFKHKYTSSGAYIEKTSNIILENNKYTNYPWFRFFLNFTEMKDKEEITYYFERGLFGLRVLKSYEFTR